MTPSTACQYLFTAEFFSWISEQNWFHISRPSLEMSNLAKVARRQKPALS
jgi:hypothetical protein